MAVTYVGELSEGRRATNSRGVRTYTRVFRLTTSSQTDNAYTVGSNISLPVIGNTFPSDGNAYCTDLDVQCVRGWRIWDVTATYSTERQLNTTPTSDPVFVQWDTEQFQKPATQDKDGDAVVNSAGDPFLPPEQMDDSRRVVTITKNLSSVPAWILTYQDAVNSDTFTIDGISIAIGEAKMQRVSVGPAEIRNGTAFRAVTFVIALRRDGWAYKILDQGYKEKDPADSTKRKLITVRGQLPTSPVLLDGNGNQLANPATANAVYLTYNVYKTQAFSSLPLT
jgi:hypothetical protein